MENPLASHDGSHRVVVQEIGPENPEALSGTLERGLYLFTGK